MAATADQDIVRDLHELNMNTVPAYRESHTTDFTRHHAVVREMLFYDDSKIFVTPPTGNSIIPDLAEQVNCRIAAVEEEVGSEKRGGKIGSKEMGTRRTISRIEGVDGRQDRGIEGTGVRDGVGRAPESRRNVSFFNGSPAGCRGAIKLFWAVMRTGMSMSAVGRFTPNDDYGQPLSVVPGVLDGNNIVAKLVELQDYADVLDCDGYERTLLELWSMVLRPKARDMDGSEGNIPVASTQSDDAQAFNEPLAEDRPTESYYGLTRPARSSTELLEDYDNIILGVFNHVAEQADMVSTIDSERATMLPIGPAMLFSLPAGEAFDTRRKKDADKRIDGKLSPAQTVALLRHFDPNRSEDVYEEVEGIISRGESVTVLRRRYADATGEMKVDVLHTGDDWVAAMPAIFKVQQCAEAGDEHGYEAGKREVVRISTTATDRFWAVREREKASTKGTDVDKPQENSTEQHARTRLVWLMVSKVKRIKERTRTESDAGSLEEPKPEGQTGEVSDGESVDKLEDSKSEMSEWDVVTEIGGEAVGKEEEEEVGEEVDGPGGDGGCGPWKWDIGRRLLQAMGLKP